MISVHLNTFVESFKKFLKKVSKGLHRNSIQFGRHVFLNVFTILKPLSFEGSFHRTKAKNAVKKLGTVSTCLYEALARCESRCFCSVWDEVCADPPLP
jgi:hypothetical protein